MPTTPWAEATRAELFVRSDLPAPANLCRRSIVSRLDALVASGVLDACSVSSWDKRVPLDAAGDGRTELDLYRRFDRWAADVGARLDPFFDTRECYSWTTGERRTELVLPAACLALYDGDDLLAVAPHADASGDVTVADALDRLTDGEADEASTAVTPAD